MWSRLLWVDELLIASKGNSNEADLKSDFVGGVDTDLLLFAFRWGGWPANSMRTWTRAGLHRLGE